MGDPGLMVSRRGGWSRFNDHMNEESRFDFTMGRGTLRFRNLMVSSGRGSLCRLHHDTEGSWIPDDVWCRQRDCERGVHSFLGLWFPETPRPCNLINVEGLGVDCVVR